MRHLTKIYYSLLFCLLLFNNNSKGQCAFEGDILIADTSITTIPIIVTGATNNDLSSNNGLKAVTLHFAHQFLGEIIVELVSPEGQKVTLVGPTVTLPELPAYTDFINWNVQFFANSLVAVPDQNYDSIWNSLQVWFLPNTYSGKYYPHSGMLEDFDMGSVNGEWKLNIIDNLEFGNGHVYCVDLIFCEEDGINQNTCSLVDHTLDDATVEACQGDPSLDLFIEPDLAEDYDPTVYGYSYLLFKDDNFHSLIQDQDLSTFDPGTYSLCGILYFLIDLETLESIPIDETKEGVEEFILENGLCASSSEECVEIVILELPEVITEEASICFGDTLVINGENYTETGVYDILTIQDPCDSMSILDLTVYDLEVIIDAQIETLSCAEPTISLNGSMTEIPNNAAISWRTDDGNILTKIDSASVVIDRSGIYTFEVSIDGCIFSEDITIGETDDFVNVDLSTNILTCLLDSTFIDLTVSDSITDIMWSGPFPFSVLNEDIRVGSGGIYSVTFTTNFGCEITREIEVFEEREYPNLTIFGDTLSCTQSEVLLFTAPTDTLGSTFQWFDDTGDLSTDTFLIVNNPGIYSVEVTTELGCERTYDYEVITEVEIIEVELISDTIDCSDPIVTVAYESEKAGLSVLWKLPSGEFVIDSAFNSTQVGTYCLTLNDEKGCSLDTSLTVVKDSLLPEVMIFGAAFLCGDDSIQLSAQTNFDDLSYEWTTPDFAIDTSESPFIYSPGTYILEVCRPNGCCASDTTEVGVDNTVPSLSFEFSNIDCTNDTVYIIPSDTSSFLMEWSLNDTSIVVTSNIIEVTEAGFYEVLVTDETNGCNSRYFFNIQSDFYSEIESLTAEPIDCANTEVQIGLVSLRDFETFLWTGPSVLDNNIRPFVGAPGEYIIDYTFTNGCSGTDTIEIIQVGEYPNLSGEDKTITCNDDEITLEVEFTSSSAFISWTDSNNEFVGDGTSVQVSNPGVYTVIGIGSGSCKDTIEIELFGDTLSPVITIVDDGEITCADSTVLISATIDSNTEFYEISGPEVIDPLDLNFEIETPGIYVINATGFNGCTSTASVEINQSTDFPEYTVNLDSLTCKDVNVDVGFDSPDPNLSVIWDGPIGVDVDAYSFNTNQAGNYVFTLSNSNGCSLKDSFFVVMDTFPPNSEIALSSQINCLTDSVVLSITNYTEDLVVNWEGPGIVDPGASEFTVGEIGQYSVSVMSQNGCFTEDTIDIVYDTLSPVISILGDPINCSAGKTFLRVESDLSLSLYEWAGPNFASESAEPLIFEEGIYYVTVTSENGCVSSDSILVEDERVFPEIEIDDFYLPCDGTAAEVFTSFISEGSYVIWFGPNNYFSDSTIALVLEAGEYIGIAFNEEGCTTADTFQVINEPILPEFNGVSDLLLCLGPIAMTASDIEDDKSIYWNGPNGYYSEDNPALTEEPGIYQLIVTGANGCVDSMAVEVVDGRIYPDAVASLNQPFQCENLEVNLSGEGSSVGNKYTVLWTTIDGNIVQGANTLSPKINEEGTYIIGVQDTEIGCISYDTLVLELQEQSLIGVEVEIVEPTCLNFGNAEINLTEIIGGFAPYNIIVDDYDYGERMDIPYLTSGEHIVTVIDSLGCSYDTLVVIPDAGVLTVELPADTTMCFGDSLLIQPIINLSLDSISSIVWSSNVSCDGCSEVQLFLNQDMEISIEVTDIGGCIVEDNFKITIPRPNNLPFPQIFSPNGDGINDVFYMPMTKGLDNINYIKIYDNWGGLLFSETNLDPGDDSKGWRGIVNGRQFAEQGVYIVEAMVTLVDGSQVSYIGDLTLVR